MQESGELAHWPALLIKNLEKPRRCFSLEHFVINSKGQRIKKCMRGREGCLGKGMVEVVLSYLLPDASLSTH
jgi:hypothetical protein